MKGKFGKKVSLGLAFGGFAISLALGGVYLGSAETLQKSSSPVLKTSVYVQTNPLETEFTLAYSSSSWEQKVGTVFKLYTSDDKTEEAGTAVGVVSETNAEKYGAIKFTLNAVPERDTAYYLTATQEGYAESNTTVLNVQNCNIVDGMTFSFGENTDVSYVEFYQDQAVYDIVLPATTAKDAAVAVKFDLLDGETAIYTGDTALTDGKATVQGSVDSTTYGKSYTYTVNFSVLELNGSGTAEDPWKLATAEDMMTLAKCQNSGAAAPMDAADSGAGNHYGYYFELVNDIDLTGYDWEPIGHSGDSYFAGNFNGNGYTVSNMTSDGLYNRASEETNDGMAYFDYAHYNAAGLFGWVYMGTIEDVIIEKATLTAIGDNEQGYAGGLMGVAYGCTVLDCAVYNSSIRSGRLPKVNTNAAGGIAAFGAGATFERCAAVGNKIESASYGGGFIGSLADDCYFTDCYVAKSKVIGNSPSFQINTQSGGFIGEPQFGTAYCTNCFAYDCIIELAKENKSNGSMGGFVGLWEYNDYSFVNCYYYVRSNEVNMPTYSVRKSGSYWNVIIANKAVVTTLPSTETLTKEDVDLRINTEKMVWEFSVDNGVTWYETTICAIESKSAEEFADGTLLTALNGDTGTSFVQSSVHSFPVLAGLKEFSVSLDESGIISIEKIFSEDRTDTYEIVYIPTGEVTLHSFIFTVENGRDGEDGLNGQDGQNGITPTLRINETSNEWEVSYNNGETWSSLGVKATGEKGEQGIQGEKGEMGSNGIDGKNGKDGADGKDGLVIAATVLGGVSLAGNIALAVWIVMRKKKGV